jgi:ABC-type multidrug transport system ATPase subunit
MVQESDEFFIKNAFAYIDQLDKHAPRLTVEETFEFAYQCATGGKFIRQKVPPDVKEVMIQADKEHLATRLALAGLGLSEVKDTYVGNTDIRGVSGGQRRRVTVGEVSSINTANCLLYLQMARLLNHGMHCIFVVADADVAGTCALWRRNINWTRCGINL